MRAVAALVRASWRTALTYRLDMVLSVGGMVVSVVPTYFVAGALQPTMADAIRGEGGQYFGFLIVGMIAISLLSAVVNRVPGALSSAVRTGTLEALFGTPARFPSILVGLSGYGLLWTAARGAMLFLAGWALGAEYAWLRLPGALLVLGLLVLAHLPFGILAAASYLAFRTTGPLPKIIVALSGLLGGVYYPTHVIPSWIEHVSAALPMTYGLRALRRVVLEGMPLGAVAGDVGILAAFAAVLLAASLAVFLAALRYGRRAGSLAHY